MIEYLNYDIRFVCHAIKKYAQNRISLDDHLGCFGELNIGDPICKTFCAPYIMNQHNIMEFLEDMISSDGMYMKLKWFMVEWYFVQIFQQASES